MEKKKIGSILVNFELGIISFDEALSLLGESTEVVSSALSESIGLYDVMEGKLKHQIEEWQTKWQHLQQLINDKIKAEDYNEAFRMQMVAATLKGCIKDAYAILEPQK